VVTPTTLSRDYSITIAYDLYSFPKVCVLAPTLRDRDNGPAPHRFKDGSLCLHLDDEWSTDLLIANTILPWTSEWLFHYEIWLATGNWNGGGEWPPRRQANSTLTANMTRSERRHQKRRPTR
jgi:hypothetical protein